MTQDRLAWGTVHGAFFIIRLCSVNYAGCPANVLQRLQGETKTTIPELGVTAISSYTLLLLLGRFSRVRLCDPTDGSPPGSAVPGILQARTLEWAAISFSNAWKWKVKVKSLSRVWLFATPGTAAYRAPPSVGFSRQEHWSGLPLPLHHTLLEALGSGRRGLCGLLVHICAHVLI